MDFVPYKVQKPFFWQNDRIDDLEIKNQISLDNIENNHYHYQIIDFQNMVFGYFPYYLEENFILTENMFWKSLKMIHRFFYNFF